MSFGFPMNISESFYKPNPKFYWKRLKLPKIALLRKSVDVNLFDLT